MSAKTLAKNYVARLGMSLDEACDIKSFLEVMDALASNGKGVFLFKIDGERLERKYTFVVNLVDADGSVVRLDTDSLVEGCLHVYAQLERLSVHVQL